MRVALRAREVQVPRWRARPSPRRHATLSDVGLAIRVDDARRPDAKVPQGRVVQQDPAAGAAARRQRTVRVWVSAGPRVTTVPPWSGRPSARRGSGSSRTA